MPTNLIQHIEWTTRNTARLKKFYGAIFDWQFATRTDDYTMIEGIGGIYAAPDTKMPVGITPYVNVANLEQTEKAIKKAGGTVVLSNQPVAGMGRFSMFTDPDGNLMAIWEAQMTQKPKAKRRAAKKK